VGLAPQNAPSNLTPDQLDRIRKPVHIWGIDANLSISEDSGINALNYSNDLAFFLDATWTPARAIPSLRDDPNFSRLQLKASWGVIQYLTGFSSAAVIPDNSHGEPTTCSNLTPNSQALVLVSDQSVQRCNYPNTYRPLVRNLDVSVSVPNVYEIPRAKISLAPALHVIVPLSLQSQYATLVTAVQAVMGFSRSFLYDSLTLSYAIAGTRYFNQYKNPQVQTVGPDLSGAVAPGYSASEVAANNASFYSATANQTSPGGFNAEWAMSNSISLSYQATTWLAVQASYTLSSSFSYVGACPNVNVGVVTNPCANANAVAQSTAINPNYNVASQLGWVQGIAGRDITDSQIFRLGLTANITEWAGLDLTWVNFSPLRTAANIVYNPFISTDYNAFTYISLGLNVNLQGMLVPSDD
jgi:hypothetical protein